MRFGRGLIGRRYDEAREPAEWRQTCLFARGDLAIIESLAIAGDQRRHDRMLRVIGLQQPFPRRRLPPGSANHLMQQLKCPFGAARVALAQSEVGIDHTDEREPRKMVPFGDELRADHDIGLALGDRFKFGLQPLDAAREIARQNERACLRKQRARFFFQSLDTGTERYERIRRPALWAGGRHRRLEAAMMADEPLAMTVLHQPSVAIRTAQAMSASATERKRRVAAPVQEQKRLLAARERLADGTLKPRRDPAPAWRPLFS